jgi:hypothetical protein
VQRQRVGSRRPGRHLVEQPIRFIEHALGLVVLPLPGIQRRRSIEGERAVVQEERVVRGDGQHAIDHRGGVGQSIEIARGVRRLDLAARRIGPLGRAGGLLRRRHGGDGGDYAGHEDRVKPRGVEVHRFSFSQVMVAPK